MDLEESSLAPSVEQILRSTVPMLGTMGMEVLTAEAGRVKTRLPWSAQNGNHIGTVYAGVLFSFLEASGGALVLVSFDVSRWIPVIVEGSIRYLRPVTTAIETDLRLTPDDIDAVHRVLDADPKHRWTLAARATDNEGRLVCEADLVYRFRSTG